MFLITSLKKLLRLKLTEADKFYIKYGQTKESFDAEVERYNQEHINARVRGTERFLKEHSLAMAIQYHNERKSLR